MRLSFWRQSQRPSIYARQMTTEHLKLRVTTLSINWADLWADPWLLCARQHWLPTPTLTPKLDSFKNIHYCQKTTMHSNSNKKKISQVLSSIKNKKQGLEGISLSARRISKEIETGWIQPKWQPSQRSKKPQKKPPLRNQESPRLQTSDSLWLKENRLKSKTSLPRSQGSQR